MRGEKANKPFLQFISNFFRFRILSKDIIHTQYIVHRIHTHNTYMHTIRLHPPKNEPTDFANWRSKKSKQQTCKQKTSQHITSHDPTPPILVTTPTPNQSM